MLEVLIFLTLAYGFAVTYLFGRVLERAKIGRLEANKTIENLTSRLAIQNTRIQTMNNALRRKPWVVEEIHKALFEDSLNAD